MNKDKLLEKYTENYLDKPFLNENIFFYSSNEELFDGMKKIGAENISDLAMFNVLNPSCEAICLKAKGKDIVEWIQAQIRERLNWLKGLSDDEKKVIIRHEIFNHDCIYNRDIEPVLELFKDVIDDKLILTVWRDMKDEYRNKIKLLLMV